MNKIEIKSKKDTISFIHSNLNEKSKPTIIFIQGSLPISIVLKEKELIWANLPFDYKKSLLSDKTRSQITGFLKTS